MKHKIIITSLLTFSLRVGCKSVSAKVPTVANLVENNLNQEQPEPKSPYTKQTATFTIDPTDADESYTLSTSLSTFIQLYSADENFENLVLLTTGVNNLTYSTYDDATNYVITISGSGLKFYYVTIMMNE